VDPGRVAVRQIITGVSLNLSTWEVVRSDVLTRLPDLGARLGAARFFEELALFGQHVERAVAAHYSSAGGSFDLQLKRQVELSGPLEPFADRLIDQAVVLQGALSAAQAEAATGR
jgi:hypothetical protein